ncbi:hypothetical protein CES85_5717 [Ochrobactrum quorumnocens]|uniref:Uncharacterized protein n=1 Tax=Ochrobactrum quorumnocens TaxID=271865 RepID=A0A248UDL9_9HYPH|nr:hypothetical protein CES85_5717 [[Ochrobactrum] quorumnocens]
MWSCPAVALINVEKMIFHFIGDTLRPYITNTIYFSVVIEQRTAE